MKIINIETSNEDMESINIAAFIFELVNETEFKTEGSFFKDVKELSILAANRMGYVNVPRELNLKVIWEK